MINKWMIEMVEKEIISGKRLPIRGGSKNKERKKRKRIIVALSVVFAPRNSESNNSSSPRITILSSFTCVSMLVDILNPC